MDIICLQEFSAFILKCGGDTTLCSSRTFASQVVNSGQVNTGIMKNEKKKLITET